MLILQRSLLSKVEVKTGRVLRAWLAKEGKDENTCACVRKCMLLFADRDNNPLHEGPLQLTAKGCFQFEFDQQICEIRSVVTKVYNEIATFIKKIPGKVCAFLFLLLKV